MMNDRKKTKAVLWRRLGIVVLATILGMNLYLVNAKVLAGNHMPMPFGYGFAVVMSGSMEPALRKDDMILVQDTERYDVDDIVVYQRENMLIVHRVISKDGDMLITQGDANGVADTPIATRDIKGEVIACIPALGIVVNALKSPLGMVLILIAVFALMEASFQTEKRTAEEDLDAMAEEIRKLKAELDVDDTEDTDRKVR